VGWFRWLAVVGVLVIPWLTTIGLQQAKNLDPKWAQSSEAELESALKEGMEEKFQIKIKSISLTKQADGNFTATAETFDGNTFSITGIVKGNRVSWRAHRVE
jgi:hypothetical protein